MVYLYDEEGKISKNIVTFKERDDLEQIRKSIRDNNIYSMSLKIIDESFIPRFQDNEVTNLLFFQPPRNIDILREILLSDMSMESKKMIIDDMESFKDFCFFARQIMDNIDFVQIGTYQIEEMQKIEELSDKIGLKSEASLILLHEDASKYNSKVLSLAKKIKEF